MANTVSMHNPETGIRGNYHPNEVEHMKLHGFRVVEGNTPMTPPPAPAAGELPPPPAPAAKPQLGMPKRKD